MTPSQGSGLRNHTTGNLLAVRAPLFTGYPPLVKSTNRKKRQARNLSLKEWRRRRFKGAMLVAVELSKRDLMKLADLGHIQRDELGCKVEIAKALVGIIKDL
jgi:hypothetical protein